MIYIKPIDHTYQICDPLSTDKNLGIEGFMEHIKEIVVENNIEIIFDEWHSDCFEQHNKQSNVETVADNLGIKYIMMDMNAEELKKSSIPLPNAGEPKYFPQRHRFWFKVMKKYLNKNILIFCGNNHISTTSEYDNSTESFNKFLKEKGFNDIKLL